MTDELVGRHRAALIEAGREAGAFLADDVSDDFLLYVPGEVKGRIAKLTARIEALEGALRPFAEAAKRIRADDPYNDRPALARVLEYRTARAALAKDKSDG